MEVIRLSLGLLYDSSKSSPKDWISGKWSLPFDSKFIQMDGIVLDDDPREPARLYKCDMGAQIGTFTTRFVTFMLACTSPATEECTKFESKSDLIGKLSQALQSWYDSIPHA